VIFAQSDRSRARMARRWSTTMLMTTAILYRIMRVSWRWPAWVAIGVFSLFITVDIAFFAANILKVAEGGWIPLVVGGLLSPS